MSDTPYTFRTIEKYNERNEAVDAMQRQLTELVLG